LGEFKRKSDEITFDPAVPFTNGLEYAVMWNDSTIARFKIPKADHIAPELLSIYPTCDTVPENLLKIYLEFSQPMVEGRSLDHIKLLNDKGDTMRGTFLDLQPELWNSEGTVLTLWLDPGRIKRDLIPNKELGTPLKEGERYILHIDASWHGKNGSALSRSHKKSFITSRRDDISPDLLAWEINVPSAGHTDVLEVTVPEPMDYFLFRDAVKILSPDGSKIEGSVQVTEKDKVFKFLPEKPWAKGKYTVAVERRLEDLAGNNLDRPFDRNVEDLKEQSPHKPSTKEFEIH
jgi:hypothetical protein